jgi:uncharacterized protein with HEPN domain
MSRSTLDRLYDILHSAVLAERHAGDLDAEALAAAAVMRDATLFRMIIICEAASQLPVALRALSPEIPWQQIRSMRNLIVDAYWRIDLGVVVDTVANDLQPLKAVAQRLIETLSRDAS